MQSRDESEDLFRVGKNNKYYPYDKTQKKYDHIIFIYNM